MTLSENSRFSLKCVQLIVRIFIFVFLTSHHRSWVLSMFGNVELFSTVYPMKHFDCLLYAEIRSLNKYKSLFKSLHIYIPKCHLPIYCLNDRLYCYVVFDRLLSFFAWRQAVIQTVKP